VQLHWFRFSHLLKPFNQQHLIRQVGDLVDASLGKHPQQRRLGNADPYPAPQSCVEGASGAGP
jgi:hypothetical protein